MLTSILLLASIGYLIVMARSESIVFDLNMPDIRPSKDDEYLCTARRVDISQEYYIVGFNPHANATKVHHIIIYGCLQPGILRNDTPRYTWNCGHMSQKRTPTENKENPYETGPVCANGLKSNIIFSWALDAPALSLPEGVGYRIGLNSEVHYLVLQEHYSHVDVFRNNPGLTDNSGVSLELVHGANHGITKQAGVYILLTGGVVKRGHTTHRARCRMYQNRDFHPFRFRVHTHTLGVKVGAYRRALGKNSKPELIGERNPQEPQMFYPVENDKMVVGQGDLVSAYCEFNNTRDYDVAIGSTLEDEMCNFYIYYWVEGDRILDSSECFGWND